MQQRIISIGKVLAAFLVVNYHTKMLGIDGLKEFARFGFVANMIFAAMSGVLIAKSIGRRGFFHRRLIRILPPLHVALFLAAIAYSILGVHLTASSAMLHATGFQYFFGDESFGGHLWFVSVILGCYLLAPICRSVVTIFATIFILAALAVQTSDLFSAINTAPPVRFLFHFLLFSVGARFAPYIRDENEPGPALAFLDSISYEVFLVHLPIALLANHFWHGSIFAYGFVFSASILVAWVVKILAAKYADFIVGMWAILTQKDPALSLTIQNSK